MVQAPARFNPLKESTKERAHERARLVLALMVQQGRITKGTSDERNRSAFSPGCSRSSRYPDASLHGVVGPDLCVPARQGRREALRFFVTLEPRFQRIAEGHLRALVDKGTVARSTRPGS